MDVCVYFWWQIFLLLLAQSVACLKQCYSSKIVNISKVTEFYFQKLNFSSSSEGSTVNLALYGEEKAETEPEKASELKACFTEGMEIKFGVSNYILVVCNKHWQFKEAICYSSPGA